MQNPSQEIANVVSLLTAPASPEIQKAAFDRYLTSDAGFRHPLCVVEPGPLSRENVLGVYQWYRVLSPEIDIKVKSVLHDHSRNVLVLDVVQRFHPRFVPVKPAPARFLVRLKLRKENGLYYIMHQEDFYHPDDFMALLLPPLVPVVRFLLSAAGIATNLYAKSAQVLGFWRLGVMERGEGPGMNSDRAAQGGGTTHSAASETKKKVNGDGNGRHNGTGRKKERSDSIHNKQHGKREHDHGAEAEGLRNDVDHTKHE